MWAIIVILWIMVVWRTLLIIGYSVQAGKQVVVDYTPGTVAWSSFTTMLSGIVLALAAVLLTQLSSGG